MSRCGGAMLAPGLCSVCGPLVCAVVCGARDVTSLRALDMSLTQHEFADAPGREFTLLTVASRDAALHMNLTAEHMRDIAATLLARADRVDGGATLIVNANAGPQSPARPIPAGSSAR